MNPQFPLFPESASAVSGQVDSLFWVWAVISAFFTALIAGLILYFMVKYRRRSPDQVGENEQEAMWLEVTWSVIPLLITLAMFAWGARVFFTIYRPPADAIQYESIGKQWMWKFQHPEGNREINTLHVPVGQPILVRLTSEDVIHSFYVPAFRVKQDAIPGRYTSIWFTATKPGLYKLFCAEYCGGEHSKMGGTVVAMEPRRYEEWLAGGVAGRSLSASGAELFNSLACVTCHREGAGGRPARGPRLEGLYGRQVKLEDGRTLVADDDYVRESILNPMAKIVAGWPPVMPTYQGQVSEEQLTQLLAYVRSLGGQSGPEAGGGASTAGGPSSAKVPPAAGSAPQKRK
jgi:cytochrome c oxidase subunit II